MTYVTLPREVVDQWLLVMQYMHGKAADDMRQTLRAALTEQVQPAQLDCDCGRTHKLTAYGWASNEPAQGELPQRITDYLSGGGLFNPELADHEAVRNLLIDCRTALLQSNAERVPLSDARIKELSEGVWGSELDYQHLAEIKFARAIEAEITKGQQ